MSRSIREMVTAAAATMSFAGAAEAQSTKVTGEGRPVRNVVLVHGAFAAGSGWRSVYDALTDRGHPITIVQNPLTSLADDVAATKHPLSRQEGPAILVGYSWGGTVITEAGVDPKVAGLSPK